MRIPQSNLPPGFRFHPTDQELIIHYLSKKIASLPLPVSVIAEVDIYKFNPWDLPGKAAFGEKEWYFFSPRDRKYPNGARPNRAAASGYWKATGTDKSIVSSSSSMGAAQENIGVKKALVFYKGKPPKGVKTNWIMHEYRLVDYNKPIKLRDTSMRLDDWVLCRIYKKSKHDVSSSTTESLLVGDDMQDQAQDQKLFKEALRPTSTTASMDPRFPTQNTTLTSAKSLSFSNLLDAMDYSMLSSFLSDQNHSDPAAPGGVNGAGGNILDRQFSSDNAPPPLNNSVPNMENMRPKRQLSNVDEDSTLYPSKKDLTSCSFPDSNNQYDNNNPPWSFLRKQSFLNPQLLLGPHLRFQG